MGDNIPCDHEKFTATEDRKHMKCNECGKTFSTDLYWGIYDQLEYGKNEGCGEETIAVIEMVEEHFKERESAATKAINALLKDHYPIDDGIWGQHCATCIIDAGATGADVMDWPCDIYATIQNAKEDNQ